MKVNSRSGHPWIALSMMVVLGTAVALVTTFAFIIKNEPGAAQPKPASLARAGLRASPYGPRGPFPCPEYWTRSAKSMSDRFPGSIPSFVWIVSTMERDSSLPEKKTYTNRTKLTFPLPGADRKDIVFAAEDINEAYLKAFDDAGYKAWLQVEPAMANIPTLIDLVLSRYGHHPCVIGFGIDVEWNKWSERDNEGVGVTDEEAKAWSERVRSHKASYLLFLKHWLPSKMPPAYRDGLVFIDDSQIFKSLDEMRDEFAKWARTFAPAPVGFQFGYPADRIWWKKLSDPPAEIGRAILAAAPNTAELYWVDFTVEEIWPQNPQ